MSKRNRIKKDPNRKLSPKPSINDREYKPYHKRNRDRKLTFLSYIMYPAHQQGMLSISAGNPRVKYHQRVCNILFKYKGSWKQRKDLPKRYQSQSIDDLINLSFKSKVITDFKTGKYKKISHYQ